MSRRIRSLEELTLYAEQLEAERRAAAPIVRAILDAPYANFTRPRPEWINLGMAEELGAAAHEVCSRSPEKSAALALMAVDVALELDESYARVNRYQVLAHGYIELANALRFQGDYQQALDALDHADAALEDAMGLPREEAISILARATTLADMAHTKEALDLVPEAAVRFAELGDTARVAQCDLLRGIIHHRIGRPGTAAGAYRAALQQARMAGHQPTVARTHMNLGILAADNGRVREAMDALEQAQAILSDDGTADLARGRRDIGIALLSAEKAADAIPLLREAWLEFHRLRVPAEARLAGLGLAEGYLALGRQTVARYLIGKVLQESGDSRADEHVLVALRYLAKLPHPTRAEVKHVRSYLIRTRTEPHLPFALRNFSARRRAAELT